ncbi:MAG: HAD family hydrolase [Magnetococcales bacterium]|nr:HAD family hydrolase [Magnetococcales bacterium]
MLQEILAELDADRSINAYQRAANRLKDVTGALRAVKIQYLSSFVLQPYLPSLITEAARQGLNAQCHIGPLNTLIQELIHPASETVTGGYDVVFLMSRLQDAAPGLALHFLTLTPEAVEEQIQNLVAEWVQALQQFRARCGSVVIVHSFAQPCYPLLGILEGMNPDSQTVAIQRLNALLAQGIRTIPDVYLLDFDRVCAQVGHANCRDDKFWYLARAPLSPVLMPELARTQATFLNVLHGTVRKCLVLDLDNTLWGGVIGEEGMAGIAIGHSGQGLVFREFQETILEFFHRGVLLAIASKNNAADALAVLRDHPDMLLREHHFAAMRIHWQPKPESVVAIARELNIGLDALVFLDDSPQERALMRAARPEVLTPELPADPMGYANLLRQLGVFDKLTLTREDRQRGAMYQQQAQRARLRSEATSMTDFYRGLAMRATVEPVDTLSFPRALDLVHKTNQFNLTTRRHDEQTLRAFLEDDRCGFFVLRVMDKFGDNGLVGVAILRILEHHAELDSFLLSCRVIGRTVETAFLSHLLAWVGTRGVTRLLADYIPTPKNQPVAQFLPDHGFTRLTDTPEGSRWSLDLAQAGVTWPDYIARGSS